MHFNKSIPHHLNFAFFMLKEIVELFICLLMENNIQVSYSQITAIAALYKKKSHLYVCFTQRKIFK